MFAKLYERNDRQLLVMLDVKDDEPEIRYFFQPKGMGVWSIAAGFGKEADAFDKAEAMFDSTDEEGAYDVAKDAIEMASQFSSGAIEAKDEV